MSTEERLQTLERELIRAKRRERWLLVWIGLAVMGGFLRWTGTGAAITAQAQPAAQAEKVIRAQGFVLDDASGNTRIALDMIAGEPRLALYDASGNIRGGLGVSTAGPALGLYDASGNIRATLGVEQTTTPDGKTVSYPESSLLLFGPDGKVIWNAPR